MLKTAVSAVFEHEVFHLRCRNLTFVGREGKHFVPRVFYRSRFVYGDVSRLSGNDTLVRTKQVGNNCCVGLCTAHEEMHLQIRIATRFLDESARRFAIMVFAVTNCLLHVGLQQALHHFWVRAFVIVALEL